MYYYLLLYYYYQCHCCDDAIIGSYRSSGASFIHPWSDGSSANFEQLSCLPRVQLEGYQRIMGVVLAITVAVCPLVNTLLSICSPASMGRY
jgi:hypothetical protein